MKGFDPFLWQNLVLFAAERERIGECIVSSELPIKCGIPPDEAVRYLDELGRRMGWSEIPYGEVILPVWPEKEKVGA